MQRLFSALLLVAVTACSTPAPSPSTAPSTSRLPIVVCRQLEPADCASAAEAVLKKRADGRSAAAIFVLGYDYCPPWMRCVARLHPPALPIVFSGLVAVRWRNGGAELYELPVATAHRPIVLPSRLMPAEDFIAQVWDLRAVRMGFAAT